MRTIVIVTALAITAGACKDGKRSKPSAGSGTAGSGTAAPAACSGGERKGPLTWYEDDYPAALACARAMQALGARAVPVTVIGQDVVRGYDTDALNERLIPLGYRVY